MGYTLEASFYELCLLLMLSVTIYIIILIVFIHARSKYKDGLIEEVIKMIIGTTGFLLVSDISLFLSINFWLILAYTFSIIFKIIALIVLAIGGLQLFAK